MGGSTACGRGEAGREGDGSSRAAARSATRTMSSAWGSVAIEFDSRTSRGGLIITDRPPDLGTGYSCAPCGDCGRIGGVLAEPHGPTWTLCAHPTFDCVYANTCTSVVRICRCLNAVPSKPRTRRREIRLRGAPAELPWGRPRPAPSEAYATQPMSRRALQNSRARWRLVPARGRPSLSRLR